MLINPDIEEWFNKLQGRTSGHGGSAPRGGGLPNYAEQALQGIVHPGAGMYGFHAPDITARYHANPQEPHHEVPSPMGGTPTQGNMPSGGTPNLGGAAKAAGLEKLGQGAAQMIKGIAARQAAAQQAQFKGQLAAQMARNPGVQMPGPPGPQSKLMENNPGATMPNIAGGAVQPPAPYSPAPIGGASEAPSFASGAGLGEPPRGPVPPIGGGGGLPTFAQGSPTRMAGGPLPGIDFGHYRDITAGIESNHGAVPDRPGSQYHGTYQMGPGWGGQGNEETRFLAGTRDNYTTLSNTLGRAPTETELYLAHQQGPAAASKMILNPGQTPAELGITGRNIVQNRGDPNAPAQQFIDKWGAKYGPGQGVAPPLTGPSALAFAAKPPDLTGPNASALAGPPPPPNGPSNQGVVPGQSDPHQPGFDPNSVQFHRTPEMNPIAYRGDAGQAPGTLPQTWQDAANRAPPIGGSGASPSLPTSGHVVTPGGGDGGEQPWNQTTGQSPDSIGGGRTPPDSTPSGVTPHILDRIPDTQPHPPTSGYMPIPTSSGDVKFTPISDTTPPVPQQPPLGLEQAMSDPGQSQLADALANGPASMPQLDQSAMLAMALNQGSPDMFPVPDVAVTPDFGGSFGGLFG